jgi:hypothetical protein
MGGETFEDVCLRLVVSFLFGKGFRAMSFFLCRYAYTTLLLDARYASVFGGSYCMVLPSRMVCVGTLLLER